jgi:hypothetical protein
MTVGEDEVGWSKTKTCIMTGVFWNSKEEVNVIYFGKIYCS